MSRKAQQKAHYDTYQFKPCACQGDPGVAGIWAYLGGFKICGRR